MPVLQTRTAAAALLSLLAAPAFALPFTAQDIEEAKFPPEQMEQTGATAAGMTATGTGAGSTDLQSGSSGLSSGASATAQTGNSQGNTTQTDAQAEAEAEEDDGQDALTAKLQILLDRAGISPGVIDGYKGGMSETALRAFEAREGLPVDGELDADVWAALGGPSAAQLTKQYTITQDDFARLHNGALPDDYADLAKLEWIGYTSVTEKLAEDFHMDEDFLIALNAGTAFEPGQTITVANVEAPLPQGTVARIVVDKPTSRLIAYDGSGAVITDYPVTVGSESTPSPSGTMKVNAIAPEPTYSYNPDLNFQQGDNDEFLTLPPGPNGPVGIVWIDLDKPTYGLHGTPYPAGLFKNQSHGCVRLTNWDAQELAELVSAGLDAGGVMVEFAE